MKTWLFPQLFKRNHSLRNKTTMVLFPYQNKLMSRSNMRKTRSRILRKTKQNQKGFSKRQQKLRLRGLGFRRKQRKLKRRPKKKPKKLKKQD